MRILSLELSGFVGLKNYGYSYDIGLGNRGGIVAIVGRNGAGKTTLLDNMHPFRIMPSRASSPKVNAFSFYDHILDEAYKILRFEIGGKTYESRLEFNNRKTRAFLFEETDYGLKPVVVDGLESDGSTTSYDKIISSITMDPQLFFRTWFIYQGSQHWVRLDPASVRSLISRVINLDRFSVPRENSSAALRIVNNLINTNSGELKRAVGQFVELVNMAVSMAREHSSFVQRYGNVADIGLNVSNDDLSSSKTMTEVVGRVESYIALVKHAINNASAEIVSLEKELESAKYSIGEMEKSAAALRSSLNATLSRLENANVELSRLISYREKLIVALRSAELAAVSGKIDELKKELSSVNKLLIEVQAAMAEVGNDSYSAVVNYFVAVKENIDTLSSLLEKRLSAIVTNCAAVGIDVSGSGSLSEIALSLSKRISELKSRKEKSDEAKKFILSVPCSGMDIQGRCALLSSAYNAAKAEVDLAVLGACESILQDVKYAMDIEKKIAYEKESISILKNKISIFDRVWSLHGRKENSLNDLYSSLLLKKKTITDNISDLEARAASIDIATHSDVVAVSKEISEIREKIALLSEEQTRMKSELAAVENDLLLKKQELASQARLVEQVKSFMASVSPDVPKLEMLVSQLKGALGHIVEIENRAASLAMGKDRLEFLCLALSDRGIQAIFIENALAEIAGVANSLLDEMPGNSLSVKISAYHEDKESPVAGFELNVYGGLKPVQSFYELSGGEKTFIGDICTRALAHVANASNSGLIKTYFSDEIDHSLDEERLKWFATVKRKFLAISGAETEIFITHSKELIACSDYVIEL